MRISQLSVLLALVLLVSPSAEFSSAFAQAPQAGSGVTGIVADSTGAVIPGAQVTVSNSTLTQSAVTDAQGSYTVLVPPGTYRVAVKAPDFTDFLSDAVNITPGQPAKLDITLQVAAGPSSSVDVQAGAPSVVETDTAQISGTVTQKEIVSLQLNGRNFTQLIALVPGVSNQTGQDEAKVGVTGSVKYSVNGGRVEYNAFDVDGADLLNTGINGSSSTLIVYPSLDSIQELKVLTSNYGAMYGRTASGTILAVTKSGAQQFHGNLYYFNRNEFFNARNFFDETNGAPLYRRNDVGGTLGGPVYIPKIYEKGKSKTFFFYSEEYRNEESPYQFNQAVPSAAERTGNFSDVCPPGNPQSFSPSKYPDCPYQLNLNTSSYRPITNLVGFGQIDRNAAAILATGIIPEPNSTSGCNSTIASCYVNTVSLPTHWREELFRIDHDITPSMRASFRFIHDSWDTVVPTPQWGVINNSFPSVENNFTGPGISLVARLTQTISPTLINEVVFTYGNSTISLNDANGPNATWQRPALLNAPCSKNPTDANNLQCPMGYLFNNGFGDKVPGLVFQGPDPAYGGQFSVDPSYMPWQHDNPIYSLADNVSRVVGQHDFQFGADWINYMRDQTNGPIGSATGDVQGYLTFNSNVGYGNSFFNFLFNSGGTPSHGEIRSFTQDSSQLTYHQRYQIAEPYFQDDWKVKSNLTVNLGLRVSLFGLYHERDNNVYNWEPEAFNASLASQAYVNPYYGTLNDNSDGMMDGPPIPLTPGSLDPRITNGLVHCGSNGVPSGCMSNHLFNPAPRVGFAWDITGKGKLVLRGGYGIFFEHGAANEANTGSLEGGPPLILTVTQNNPSSFACIGSVSQSDCTGANLAGAAYPLNLTSIPTHAQWPYVQQWSLSLQKELPAKFLGSVAWVGNKGTHLTDQRQLNQLPPVSAADNPFSPGQPLVPVVSSHGETTGDCASFGYAPGYDYFTLANGAVVTQGTPGYNNLIAACFGTVPLTALNLIGGRGFFPDPNTLRLYNGIGQIVALENGADSSYNSFQATLRRVQGPLTIAASYTWSHSLDNSSDRSDSTFVNSYNLRSNWASSGFDQRHLFTLSYVYELPFLQSFRQPSRLARALLGNWELSGITSFQSGIPFSVINGTANGVSSFDNAGVANGVGAGSYPDVIGAVSATVPKSEVNNGLSFGPLLINPGMFIAPQGLTFGDAGRNSENNPSRWNFDASLLKHFKVTEALNGELRFETFNVFNHTQFQIYDPNRGNQPNNTINCYAGSSSDYSASGGGGIDCLTGSAFLHPIDAHRPRTIQLGIKFAF